MTELITLVTKELSYRMSGGISRNVALAFLLKVPLLFLTLAVAAHYGRRKQVYLPLHAELIPIIWAAWLRIWNGPSCDR